MNGISRLLAFSMLVLAFALPAHAGNNVTNGILLLNSSVVDTITNFNISFTTSAPSYNLTNINVTFPANYNIANAVLANSSVGGLAGNGSVKQLIGQVVVLRFNLTANVSSTAVSINLSTIRTNITASNQHVMVQTFEFQNTTNTTAVDNTTDPGMQFTLAAGNMVNVTIFANASSVVAGQRVNISAIAYDAYGNANNSGGFNFSSNNTAVLVNVTEGGGAAEFVAGLAGANLVSVNVSAVCASGIWNDSLNTTGNVTVTAGNMVNVTIFANASSIAANQSVNISAMGYDAYGNANNTGGFNFSTNSTSMLIYVSGNGTGSATFRGGLNGSVSVNVSANLSAGIWNNSLNTTGNITVASAGALYFLYVNVTTVSLDIAGTSTARISVTGYDLYGNENNTANWSWSSNASNVSDIVSGNATREVLINSTLVGQALIRVNSTINGSVTNTTTVTVSNSTQVVYTGSGTSGYTGSSGGTGGVQLPTATPTEEATPEPTAEAPGAEQTQVLDESSSVTGTFSEDSATFTLTYTAPSDFQGSLSFTLPFDYADFLSGTVALSPAPDEVKEGSIVAIYKDVKLAAGESFGVTARVSKAVSTDVLSQFAAPAATKKKPTAAATAAPTALPSAPAAKPAAAAVPDYTLWIVGIVILAVLVYYYFSQKKGK